MDIITNYNWPGNIRQLKNFVSQLSVIEKERNISAQTILDSLPENKNSSNIPILFEDKNKADLSEREILYKVLFDMKRDLTELKKITFDLTKKDGETEIQTHVFNDLSENDITLVSHGTTNNSEESDSAFSLADHEKMLIKQSLEKHKGKRKLAAEELGISERTLYRKIKEFNL